MTLPKDTLLSCTAVQDPFIWIKSNLFIYLFCTKNDQWSVKLSWIKCTMPTWSRKNQVMITKSNFSASASLVVFLIFLRFLVVLDPERHTYNEQSWSRWHLLRKQSWWFPSWCPTRLYLYLDSHLCSMTKVKNRVGRSANDSQSVVATMGGDAYSWAEFTLARCQQQWVLVNRALVLGERSLKWWLRQKKRGGGDTPNI